MPGDLDFEEELKMGAKGGSPAGKKRRGSLLLFLLGLGLGVAVTLAGPRYLPELFRRTGEEFTGEVLAKQVEEKSLLLTVQTPAGAILATFKKRMPEIDLLIAEGDTVTLRMNRYEPFVKDPAFTGVRKASSARGSEEDVAPVRQEVEGVEPVGDEEEGAAGGSGDEATG